MVLFQFLEVIEVFGDYLWVEYLCHAFIMPSTKRNGITYAKRIGWLPFMIYRRLSCSPVVEYTLSWRLPSWCP